MSDRPTEPTFTNKDPEQWAEIAEWEAQRADAAEAECRELEKELKRRRHTDDFVSELNNALREITGAINGDDEPAFLDDAVRRAVINAVAAERREIEEWLHTMSRRKHEEAENTTDYEEQLSLLGEMGAYFAACEWVKQRGFTKSTEELNRWYAPFDKEQVKALDRRQADKTLHPYTCPECSEELIPYDDGWYCPKHGLVQTWALDESAYLPAEEGDSNG